MPYTINYQNEILSGSYQGDLAFFKPSGQGIFKAENGVIIDAVWDAGVPTAVHKMTLPNGRHLAGRWQDDTLNVIDYHINTMDAIEDLKQLDQAITDYYAGDVESVHYHIAASIAELNKDVFETENHAASEVRISESSADTGQSEMTIEALAFYQMICEAVHGEGDSHFKSYYQFYNKALPFTVAYIDGIAYIDQPNDELTLAIGDKLMAINDTPIKTYFESGIFPSSRGRAAFIERYALSDVFLNLYFGVSDSFKLVFQKQDGQLVEQTVSCTNAGLDAYIKKYHGDAPVSLIEGDGYHVLKIKSMTTDHLSMILQDCFNVIQKDEKLLIDISACSGGDSGFIRQLMMYFPVDTYQTQSYAVMQQENLWIENYHQEPVYYGKVFVCISENTSSSAAALAAVIKASNTGQIVGSDIGELFASNGDAITIPLNHSHIEVDIPRRMFTSPIPNDQSSWLKADKEMNIRLLKLQEGETAAYNAIVKQVNTSDEKKLTNDR